MNGFPIPVAVLTGFLGAGKTSLLNSLLKDEMLSNAAVIINEFGECRWIICWLKNPTRTSSRWRRAACAAPSAAISSTR